MVAFFLYHHMIISAFTPISPILTVAQNILHSYQFYNKIRISLCNIVMHIAQTIPKNLGIQIIRIGF